MPEQQPMKIAFVYDVIYPYVKGGVEKRVWELSVRLAARGHDVHIFGMKYWDGDDILIREGVILHGVCPARPLYASGRRTVGEAIVFGIRLIPHMGKYRFDLIDCQQFPYFSCLSAKVISLFKKNSARDHLARSLGRLLVHVSWPGRRDGEVHRAPCGPAHSPCDRGFNRLHKNNSLRLGHPKTITIIPNGVDQKRIAAIPPAAEPIGSHLCRAPDPGKTCRPAGPGVCDTVRRAPGTHASHHRGWAGAGVASSVSSGKLGLGDRIRIRGFEAEHDDLIARMKASKVFVLPSTREGFGITALEALACGLPVVTIDHPANAIRELITEKNGFLSSLSAEDLADKIREALAHHEEMRDACIATAAAFDWDRIAAESEEYYRSVIAKIRPAKKTV